MPSVSLQKTPSIQHSPIPVIRLHVIGKTVGFPTLSSSPPFPTKIFPREGSLFFSQSLSLPVIPVFLRCSSYGSFLSFSILSRKTWSISLVSSLSISPSTRLSQFYKNNQMVWVIDSLAGGSLISKAPVFTANEKYVLLATLCSSMRLSRYFFLCQGVNIRMYETSSLKVVRTLVCSINQRSGLSPLDWT